MPHYLRKRVITIALPNEEEFDFLPVNYDWEPQICFPYFGVTFSSRVFIVRYEFTTALAGDYLARELQDLLMPHYGSRLKIWNIEGVVKVEIAQ
jgi:hypothetical protein